MKTAAHDDSNIVDLGAVGSAPAVDPDVVDIGKPEDKDGLPAHAVLNDDGTITLPLFVPVTLKVRQGGQDVREEEFRELTMRRLKGADMRAISEARGAQMSVVGIARSAGIHILKMEKLFDQMDAADTNAASQVLSFFLGNGPTTGR